MRTGKRLSPCLLKADSSRWKILSLLYWQLLWCRASIKSPECFLQELQKFPILAIFRATIPEWAHLLNSLWPRNCLLTPWHSLATCALGLFPNGCPPPHQGLFLRCWWGVFKSSSPSPGTLLSKTTMMGANSGRSCHRTSLFSTKWTEAKSDLGDLFTDRVRDTARPEEGQSRMGHEWLGRHFNEPQWERVGVCLSQTTRPETGTWSLVRQFLAVEARALGKSASRTRNRSLSLHRSHPSSSPMLPPFLPHRFWPCLVEPQVNSKLP